MHRRDTEEAVPLHLSNASWPCLTYSLLEKLGKLGKRTVYRTALRQVEPGWKAVQRTAQHPNNRRAQAQLGLVVVKVICYQAR